MSQQAIACLGRHGDICIALSIAWEMHKQSSQRIPFIVSQEYASILSGASYVEPIVVPYQVHELPAAIDFAAKRGFEAVVPQVYRAKNFVPQHDSFAVDMVARAGYLSHWSHLSLNFDNRDRAREAELVKKYIEADGLKRLVLLASTGTSSPFPQVDQLRSIAAGMACQGVQVLDLANVQAEQFYDLLGLIERATVLISIDTGVAHLAWACPHIPVIQLVADHPSMWNGMRPRSNVVLSMRYGEFPARSQEITDAIDYYAGCTPQRLVHVFSQFSPSDVETRRRQSLALTSWRKQYALNTGWASKPLADTSLPRMFTDGFRQLPYIRDLLDRGCDNEPDSAIIVFANSDIVAAPSLTTRLLQRMQFTDVCYAHRRDLKVVDHLLSDASIRFGMVSPGMDLFAFRASWWRTHRLAFPDMVLGAEWWDRIMVILMEKSSRSEINIRFDDICCHQQHAAAWERPENRYSIPSQHANSKLAEAFFRKERITWFRVQNIGVPRRVPPSEPSVTQQGWDIKIMPTHDVSDSHRLCYFNTSIIKGPDGRVFGIAREARNNAPGQGQQSRLIAFDWHSWNTPVEKRSVVLNTPKITSPKEQHEDPRVMVHDGMFYVCYCWQVPGSNRCGQRISVFDPQWHHQLTVQPNYGSHIAEKNWLPFTVNDRLHFVYKAKPTVVLRVDNVDPWVSHEYRTDTRLPFNHGEVRGGTPPVLHDGLLWLFGHTSIEWDGRQRRYCAMAYAMEPTQPFRIVKITPEILVKGSEQDSRICAGPPCFYPTGAYIENNLWRISGGVNDEMVFLWEVHHSEIVKRMVDI